MLPEVTGKVLNAQPEVDEVLYAAVIGIEAGVGHLRGKSADAITDLAERPLADLLGKALDLIGSEAERLADLACGGTLAIGDDVRGHRRAMNAVAFVDVLDHLLALVARR